MARVFDKDVAAHMKRLGMIRFSARRPAEVLVHLPRAFKPISRLLWSLKFHLKIVVYLLLATDLYCSNSRAEVWDITNALKLPISSIDMYSRMDVVKLHLVWGAVESRNGNAVLVLLDYDAN